MGTNTDPQSTFPSTSLFSGSKLTRRTLLGNGVKAGLGASMLSPLLAACGEDSGSTPKANGPVTIQYAALSDQTGEQAAEIARFNDLHKGKIKVEYQQLPPVATDQYSKFVTSFRSQDATPDVVHIDVTWPAQFASSGWLEPLDRYASADYLKQFYPSAAEVAKIDGKIYGIQRYLDIGLLYYRTDLVQKYGGQVPQTRAEMESLAAKILAGEKNNGIQYGYLMPGKKIEAIVDEWLELLWGAGGDIGKPGSLKVDDNTSIDALQYLHDLIHTKKLSPTGTNTYAPNDILNLFNNGQAPFMRNWTFAYAIANAAKTSKVAGKVGIAPTLALNGQKGQGCTGGWVLGINANSKYKDESWAFIDFMLNKQTQSSLAQNAGLVSSRPDVLSDPELQKKHPQFKDLATILNSGHNRPQLKTYNQFTTPLQAAINGVLSNQQSPADALHGVQSQIASLS
ncbi:putative ABC transporter-binding protein [Dictyobacter alpinus]|uniref:Putative ABC transporter-binding protein n=1 Tax=Dictyobacter alpinus TaxID=2014873 RepID=A0A402BG35_9CHLR|nr:ABC transporter substrate-binding protein [Dictyobacter alpinus]GCE30368.1 putative ABC transporter-binding protein [Dictyobacter alpinus]